MMVLAACALAADWAGAILKHVNLAHNNITGTLPSAWASSVIASYLVVFNAGFNQLTGAIPASEWAVCCSET